MQQAPPARSETRALRRIAAEFPIQESTVRQIIEAMRAGPDACVLEGFGMEDDGARSTAVARAFCEAAPRKRDWLRAHERVSHTRVRVHSEAVEVTDAVTRQSRSHLPMDLHTDSSYRRRPHELVLFHMIRPAASGGQSRIASVREVVSRLDPMTRAALREPVFPFTRGEVPVLTGTEDDPCLRYYRHQLDHRLDQGRLLPRPEAEALERLDAVLRDPETGTLVDLAPGEALVLDNRRCLHGRTGFLESSDRLMIRIRIEAGCLT